MNPNFLQVAADSSVTGSDQALGDHLYLIKTNQTF